MLFETTSWEELGELCEFKNGLWKGKKEPYMHVGVIRNTNFTKEGYLDDTNIAYLDVEVKQYSSRKLEYGDIILEKSGGGPKQAVGRVIPFEKSDGEYSFSNFTSIVRIKDKSKLHHKYLHKLLHFYYISGSTEPMQKNSTGIRNLQLKEYKQLQIPLPPLPEQKRIVNILDEAFAGISQAVANAEKNLANARELFESYLQKAFENNVGGSKSETLNSICDLIVDCEHKTAPTQKTGYPSIRTPNIGCGSLILDNVNRVSEEVYKEWTRRAIPQADDLILAREAPAGNIAVIPKNINVCLGQRTVLIRPKIDKFISKYLAYLILSNDVQKQLLSHSTGATVEHINMKDIRAFKIYNLPALNGQQKIIDDVDNFLCETKKLETIYQQKLKALTELKQSILQKAFSGGLTTEDLPKQVNG